MGLFDPKAKEADVRREISRLTGENLLLQHAVALLIRHSPDREKLLTELTIGSSALQSSAREAQRHPVMVMAIKDTADSIRRMA